MAELLTYPLNNTQYYAEDAEIFNSTRTSGVFANDSFPLTKVAGTWNVKIGKGLAWIKNHDFAGKAVALKEEETLTVSLPDFFDRIDAVVLRFSSVDNKTTLYIKKGKDQEKPIPPDVERSESVYELHLYHIRVPFTADNIAQCKITDLRQDPDYCGLMYDAVTPASGFYVETSEKGAAGGVASLNESGKIPNSQLNMGVASGLATLDASGKVPSGQLPSMSYIPLSQKGSANGVAALDAYGKILDEYFSVVVGNLGVTIPPQAGTLISNQSKYYKFGKLVMLSINFTATSKGAVSSYAKNFDLTGYPQQSSSHSIPAGGLGEISADAASNPLAFRTEKFNETSTSISAVWLSNEPSGASGTQYTITGSISYIHTG